MNTLLEQIKKKNAKAFTHSGKFHADDVFSYALLLYLNPAITITRGNKVPKDFDGIVFDLEQSKPSVLKSERKDDGVFTASYAYRYQWKILKEKYGEHFKS